MVETVVMVGLQASVALAVRAVSVVLAVMVGLQASVALAVTAGTVVAQVTAVMVEMVERATS
jgi:hypothetical protein